MSVNYSTSCQLRKVWVSLRTSKRLMKSCDNFVRSRNSYLPSSPSEAYWNSFPRANHSQTMLGVKSWVPLVRGNQGLVSPPSCLPTEVSLRRLLAVDSFTSKLRNSILHRASRVNLARRGRAICQNSNRSRKSYVWNCPGPCWKRSKRVRRPWTSLRERHDVRSLSQLTRRKV